MECGALCWFGLLFVVSFLVLILRAIRVLPWRKKARSSPIAASVPVKTLVVLGSG
jgi:hypothetical protein